MFPVGAIIMSFFWVAAALFMAVSRGYSRKGIALCLAGIIIGGVGAGVPGAYALSGPNSIISPEREVSVACGAVLLGALAGLHLAERVRSGEFPGARQIFNAGLGFLIGGAAAYVVYFMTLDTWANDLGLYVLVPATAAAATLAGSAVSHPPPALR